jgi:NAD(P)-dependent dehydrogenase (short-subunit alcohol dehydrogenase family)
MTGVNSTAPQTSRIVAVTGAGTGIGRATARAFAAEGAHVIAIGRRAERLMETAAENDRITGLTADITAEGEPSRIVQAVLERHGRLDVLVNNVGIVRGGALGTLTPEMIETQLATNLVAPILLAQAALPFLEASGRSVSWPRQPEPRLVRCGTMSRPDSSLPTGPPTATATTTSGP